MVVGTSISFLGSQQKNARMLGDLRTQLLDLQRQATTLKKSDTYSGLGSNAVSVQRYRMEVSRITGYMDNIGHVETRIKAQSNAITTAAESARQLLESITIEVREGNVDFKAINTIATNALQLVQDALNLDVDGRYMFSGSDTSNAPYQNPAALQMTMQSFVSNWLNGTTSTAQFKTDVNNISNLGLGYGASLSSAGSVYARVDDNVDIDYTVMGDENGFDDLIRGLSLAKNLPIPNEATDTATLANYHEMLDHVQSIVRRGVESLDAAAKSLAGKANMIGTIETRLTSDKAVFEDLFMKIEEVDSTEAVIKLQAVQNQLTASYQITNIVSQLSLVNFI